MPTYQYACTACGHELEAVQSFSDEPLTECPACEGRLRKLYSAVGIVFKGSGFYRTDSRGGAGKDTAGTAKTETTRTGSDKKEPAGTAASSGASSTSGATTSGSASSTSGTSSSSASSSSSGKSSSSKPAT